MRSKTDKRQEERRPIVSSGMGFALASCVVVVAGLSVSCWEREYEQPLPDVKTPDTFRTVCTAARPAVPLFLFSENLSKACSIPRACDRLSVVLTVGADGHIVEGHLADERSPGLDACMSSYFRGTHFAPAEDCGGSSTASEWHQVAEPDPGCSLQVPAGLPTP
jgi:hypothetical protein